MNAVTLTQPTSKLAAPGAGLPWVERNLANLLIRWHAWRNTQESAIALIQSEREKILSLARSCNAESAARCILVNRLRGMEDSSRCWSVYMTVEHLLIVNTGMAKIIASLGRGEIPARVVNTADVKPHPKATCEVLNPFADSCDALKAAIRAIPQPRSTVRHSHPWFGPLNAAQWHHLAGIHMRLHRHQITGILHGLSHPISK